MTNTSIPRERLAQLVAAGEELTEATVPILLIKPRSKPPVPHPETGSWWTITDPDGVERAVKEAAALSRGDLENGQNRLSTKTRYHLANCRLENFHPPQGLTFPLAAPFLCGGEKHA